MAKKPTSLETDGAYLLKVLLYLVVGLIWVQYERQSVFPLGLVVGFLFTRHEHFKLDRRMEYVILIFASIIALLGAGLFINLNR